MIDKIIETYRCLISCCKKMPRMKLEDAFSSEALESLEKEHKWLLQEQEQKLLVAYLNNLKCQEIILDWHIEEPDVYLKVTFTERRSYKLEDCLSRIKRDFETQLPHTSTIEEQIAAINEWQQNDHVHPLTCGNNSNHANLIPIEEDSKIVLKCSDCDYKQNWVPEIVFGSYMQKNNDFR